MTQMQKIIFFIVSKKADKTNKNNLMKNIIQKINLIIVNQVVALIIIII